MAEPSTDQGQTTSAEASEPQRGGVTWLIWIFLFLLFAYPLSAGPACKLIDLGLISTECVGPFLRPSRPPRS
jgi:hypothetical protein